MALSDYERRVLAEIEWELRTAPAGRAKRVAAVLTRYAAAITCTTFALLLIVLLALYSGSGVAAPVCGITAGLAGYAIRRDQRRAARPRRRRSAR
jgi:hypothetical protein